MHPFSHDACVSSNIGQHVAQEELFFQVHCGIVNGTQGTVCNKHAVSSQAEHEDMIVLTHRHLPCCSHLCHLSREMGHGHTEGGQGCLDFHLRLAKQLRNSRSTYHSTRAEIQAPAAAFKRQVRQHKWR